MATLTIDTYNFINKLVSSGIREEHAKAALEAIQEIEMNSIASKDDMFALKEDLQYLDRKIDDVEHRLDKKIDDVEHRLDKKIDNVEGRLNAKIESTKYDILKWLIPLILGQYVLLISKII